MSEILKPVEKLPEGVRGQKSALATRRCRATCFCLPTFEFTGLRGFLRRSGGMMGSAFFRRATRTDF